MVKDLSYKHEVYRKTVHIITGVITIGAGLWVERVYGIEVVKALLLVALLFSLFVEYFRMELKVNVYILSFMQRKREIGQLHAITNALMGSLIALSFFDLNVAVAAIAMFFFGDAAAALVGRKFGRQKLWRKKTVIGSLAMFVISLAIGVSLLPFWVGASMAVAATLVEIWAEAIDDSLVIILFGGFVGHVLLLL